ncbi:MULTISPECIES: carbohydrate ABC transporter permease [Blautia]|uniref:carbohydrate ABC transporter permease n=1 Tax=Blautia TaxID=572511 RepID=UPI000BA48B45|nr:MULTISPECIES: sugar ABC transporter permease [Blautia]
MKFKRNKEIVLKNRYTKRDWICLLFVFPAFIYHALVVILPSLKTVFLSFFDWNGISEPEFVGIANYVEMFTKDTVLPIAFKNTMIWTLIFITVPIVLSILVAVCVTKVKKHSMQMFYRTVYFLPYVLSAAIAGKIWSNLYNPFYGINTMFESMGFHNLAQVLWLGDQKIALFAVAFVSNWSWWGFVMVLFISALQQVDPDLYESASIDGANGWKSFIHVTLPGIAPTIVFVISISLMWSILSFDFVWVMTMGGPGQATEMLSTWIYKNAFVSYRAGYANAICVLQSFIVLLIFFVNQKIRKRVEDVG